MPGPTADGRWGGAGRMWPRRRAVLLAVAVAVAVASLSRGLLPRGPAAGHEPAGAAAAPPPAPPADPPPAPPRPLVVFVGEESLDFTGSQFRVFRAAEAARIAGYATEIFGALEVRDDPAPVAEVARTAAVLVVFRNLHCKGLETVVHAAREGGAVVFYDIDDLLLDPDMIDARYLDFLRTYAPQDIEGWKGVARLFAKALALADFAVTTTEGLAAAMRRRNVTAFVVPNTFDRAFLEASNQALFGGGCGRGPGLRIGYAPGTLTHQRDFNEALPAVARILRARPDVRFAYFAPYLNASEFPALANLTSQLEPRPPVPLAALPSELCRFDVNLAPLQPDNPFTAAKSELKFFDAALVRVPTVASPVGPFRAAIADGRTGFLAGTGRADGWYARIEALLGDAGLRRKMGRRARGAVLWRYSPERRAILLSLVFRSAAARKAGDAAEADRLARVHAEELAREPASPPPLPKHRTVYSRGNWSSSLAAVVVGRPGGVPLEELPVLQQLELVVVTAPGARVHSDVLLALRNRPGPRAVHVALDREAQPGELEDLGVWVAAAGVVYLPRGRTDEPCARHMLQALSAGPRMFAVPGPACGADAADVYAAAAAGPLLLRKAAWAGAGGLRGIAGMKERGMDGVAA